MNKFFEPISISATHIYYSALELCPVSSIVRRLYYDQCHGITRFPRLVAGTPDSWDQTISFSGKNDYKLYAWSPCGRFVAVQTKETVEIRNQLTFELLAILRSTKNTRRPSGPLAYSPDGRSLACGCSDVIVIWDVQTGGVAKEIEHWRWSADSLVWSLDGREIATALTRSESTPRVMVHDVASGVKLFTEEIRSGDVYHLWAHEKSFRFMTTSLNYDNPTLNISISGIGPTPIRNLSLSVAVGERLPVSSTISFSPSTYRVSISGHGTLRVLDVRSSNFLLEALGDFTSSQFSSDGCLFAASHWDGIRIWKYTTGSYTLWGAYQFRNLPFPSRDDFSFQFSPNSSSILCQCGNVLQLRRLHDPLITPKTCRQYAAISRSGRYIVTARELESTVTIINPHSQLPSRFIDTGVEIEGLVITGNVLLVASSEKVMAWLVTKEGSADGLFGNRRTGYSGSIWTIPSPSRRCRFWDFRVEGEVGVIQTGRVPPFIYHTGTGDILEHYHEPQHSISPRILFYQQSDGQEYYYLRYHGSPHYDTPPKDGWKISQTSLGSDAGWITDPKGRHRFWVPVEWRESWDRKNWHHDIMTLFSNVADQPVVISENLSVLPDLYPAEPHLFQALIAWHSFSGRMNEATRIHVCCVARMVFECTVLGYCPKPSRFHRIPFHEIILLTSQSLQTSVCKKSAGFQERVGS